jgi:hypothetical protein
MTLARIVSSSALLSFVMAATASAQQPASVRGYVTYGTTTFEAEKSFEAITGEKSNTGLGGGATVIGLWLGLFTDIGFSQQTMDGQRVFVDGGTVYPLGIPVEIKIRPIDIAGGWRFFFGRVSPYAGAGISLIKYEETGDFALNDDNVSESKAGPLILTGVDLSVNRWLHVGGELRYRAVKGVLGAGGVSQAFGEDQLGGYSFALRVSVGR